jgi:hypothetical protein
MGAKLEVRDNHLGPTILSISSLVCWSSSAFGALGNSNSALEVGGCLLGMAFILVENLQSMTAFMSAFLVV